MLYVRRACNIGSVYHANVMRGCVPLSASSSLIYHFWFLKHHHSAATHHHHCRCGTCHMASLFTSPPTTATPTIFSEIILQTCQHQLPEALAASIAHRNTITSLPMSPLSRNILRFSRQCGPLLTTSVSSPSHFSTSLLKPRGLNFFLHEDYPRNLTQGFYCRNKLLGNYSINKAQRTS